MYLKRKVDEFLNNWKNDEDKSPLIIRGCRQVGKTESILHFAYENYKSVIEINFARDIKYKQIITDGYENASKEFTYSKIKEMIEHQRNKYNWIFTFIGANIDTAEVGNNLGIDAKLSKTYTASKEGTESVFMATSKAMSYTRGVGGQSVNCCAFADSLSDILDEVE